MNLKIKIVPKNVIKSVQNVDKTKIIRFLKANPRRFTLSEVARKFLITRQLLHSILKAKHLEHKNLSALLVNKIELLNRKIRDTIVQNPYKFTAVQIAKQVNCTTNQVLAKATKLSIINLLVLKIPHQERIEKALTLLRIYPNKYEFSTLAKKFGLSTTKLKEVSNIAGLSGNFLVLKRSGITKKVVEFLNNNSNKYTLTDLSKILDLKRSHLRTIVKNNKLRSYIIPEYTKTAQELVDLQKFLLKNSTQFTVFQLSDMFSINSQRISRLVKNNPKLRKSIIIKPKRCR